MAGAVLCLVPSGIASAQNHRVLYSFCAMDQCTDGYGPYSNRLTMDSAGTLYGTTFWGGAHDWGTVFALKPKKGGYTHKLLYSFCIDDSCSDGYGVSAGPILDLAGNLYGTASAGGAYHQGVVWELARAAGTRKFRILHSFCASGGCPDGQEPEYTSLTYPGAAAGLPYDGVSALFGTTALGGGHGLGAVYALTPVAGTHRWKERVLYSFCAKADCADGYYPVSLVMDGSGRLFGTTHEGGARDKGGVFELSPAGNKWQYSVIHNFCSKAACTDGDGYPASSLALDAQGDLLGTTVYGGKDNDGVLFKVTVNNGDPQYTVLHHFCDDKDKCGGAYPWGALAMDEAGNIFGGTSGGAGQGAFGGVYRFDGSTAQTLYRFCQNQGCLDGSVPLGGVITDSNGHLFGTTHTGGAYGLATVYELTP